MVSKEELKKMAVSGLFIMGLTQEQVSMIISLLSTTEERMDLVSWIKMVFESGKEKVPYEEVERVALQILMYHEDLELMGTANFH